MYVEGGEAVAIESYLHPHRSGLLGPIAVNINCDSLYWKLHKCGSSASEAAPVA
jgi:hypothetical protein